MVLVKNAGLAGQTASTWELTDAAWREVMAVNINGPPYLGRAVIPDMRSRG
jgi:2-dehydro-3-deoxy-L-rhamnonate dehydrogenase (NAD+)